MMMQRSTVVLGGAGILMMSVGACLGAAAYMIQKKRLEEKYDLIAKEEIAKARDFYKVLNKKDEFSNPQTMAETYVEVVETLEYVTEEISEEEISGRDLEEPYVITREEYFENPNGYEQNKLTYFENDDMLVDDEDTPILSQSVDSLVGEKNLSRFGIGSRSHNMVYIRNDELESDFEIIQNKGSYAKDVLGFVEHSEPRGRPRKFRRDNE
jgi:hypothetical protein